MKELILIRHGKASADYTFGDFERPLVDRGIEKSIIVANQSVEFIDSNATIWSSAGKRALQTAQIMVAEWKLPLNSIEIKVDLYTFNSNDLTRVIETCPNEIDKLILFGHNYAITDFVNNFGTIYVENVPTSGFVSIHFDTNNWKNLIKGKTQKIIFSKEI